MNLASSRSLVASTVSTIIQTKSNLDSIVNGNLMLSCTESEDSYRPSVGFAAASIEVLAFKVATMPALAMLTVCCSIASWIAVRSLGSILSNSSMHAMPWSARTSAPASSVIAPVSGS